MVMAESEGREGCVYSEAMRRKRAEPRRVELTGGQRARLEALWFVYGNHGPKATMENHGFIQGFLERDAETARLLAARDADEAHPLRTEEEAVEVVYYLRQFERGQSIEEGWLG